MIAYAQTNIPCPNCRNPATPKSYRLLFTTLDGVDSREEFRFCDQCLYEKLTGKKAEFKKEIRDKYFAKDRPGGFFSRLFDSR